jgi:hypothetical protein
LITTRIVMVSRTNDGFSPNHIFWFFGIIATEKLYILFYEMEITEEDYDIPDVDILDIFDADDEADQHKKPRAKEYPSETIYGDDDEDQHKKRRAEEHTSDTFEGDNDEDQHKTRRAEEHTSDTFEGGDDEDQHKKCRAEKHTSDTLDGDDKEDQNNTVLCLCLIPFLLLWITCFCYYSSTFSVLQKKTDN